MGERPVVVTICGGGNGAHVLAGLAASRPNVSVRVFSLYADEAERWSKISETSDLSIHLKVHGKEQAVVKSRPALITKNAREAIEGADIIVLVVPAFAHGQYFAEMAPYTSEGTVIVGMPGGPGYEFEIYGCFGDKAKTLTMMSYETLPWACRISEFGKRVEVLGTKLFMIGAKVEGTVPPKCSNYEEVLQTCMGEHPLLKTEGCLLGITLMSGKSYVHPGIMYQFWDKYWDGKPLDTPPLFYEGIDEATAELLTNISVEIVAIAKAAGKDRPDVSMETVKPIYDRFVSFYSDEIVDKTNLYTVIKTNRAYIGLVHPTTKTEDGKYLPDFSYRYLDEDIPYGLVVMRGVAEVVGVSTPLMDEVLLWAQKQMGKEYLVDGRLTGKDVAESRAPQRFGLTTHDQILFL